MKLFAIRVENGETVLIAGKDQQEALKSSGLTVDALEELKEKGCPYDHAALVDSGVGPQRYEVIELNHLQIRLILNEQGSLELSEFDLQTTDDLCRLYPILDEEEERWTLESIMEHRAQYERSIQRAVSLERTRLAIPADPLDSALLGPVEHKRGFA